LPQKAQEVQTMPIIHTLPLGDYQTNCYIVHNPSAKSCAIIDPGFTPERVLAEAERLGLTVDAVLLTHGHFDHVGGVEKIVTATGCALWMGQADYNQFPSPITSYFYPLANRDFAPVQFCQEGTVIQAGGLSFATLSTPGHTNGSVCFLCEDNLFSGDTLFCRSCGRTDLPGGSWEIIQKSLGRLAALPGDYTVYPGHGQATKLSDERKFNPYF
jgi:glyoxylase-like metal-dependent hydrolase (beta-lactamase superfamily II)